MAGTFKNLERYYGIGADVAKWTGGVMGKIFGNAAEQGTQPKSVAPPSTPRRQVAVPGITPKAARR